MSRRHDDMGALWVHGGPGPHGGPHYMPRAKAEELIAAGFAQDMKHIDSRKLKAIKPEGAPAAGGEYLTREMRAGKPKRRGR